MEKYHDYEPEDFVSDKEFVDWVRFPTDTSSAKWEQLIAECPEKKLLIERAALIVRSLEPVEAEISKDRLDAVWLRIAKSRRSAPWRLYSGFMKYAAVFILAFLMGLGGAYLLKEKDSNYTEIYTEINVPYGERSEIVLYDGTKVWLNSGTTFKFPLVFKPDQRQVFIRGEGFFDIASDREKPFIVNARQMNIEVTGTRFNICAYPDDPKYFATLEEGNILATNTLTGEKLDMRPGDQAILDLGTKTISVQPVDTKLYTSWKENMLRFENAEFAEVVKKMERWYDVKITVDATLDFNKRYNMTVKTESLREMLRLLAFTTPMSYEINEDQVFIKRP
ncbi:FecR family protein [Gaoshiqia sp. Z1-71]|uniref:FecR family protein n=1 Tax=Gaoshiqia hydrogeniformans TaxID=3290090 RepID=UPI003BF80A22